MQNLCYEIGGWHAAAALERIGAGKLMAVISLSDRKTGQDSSRHTVVFDHVDGQDIAAEAEMLVRRLVRDLYGG